MFAVAGIGPEENDVQKRIRRQLAIGLSTLVVTGLIATSPARAETDAIRQAQQALAKIQEESSKIDSDYANAQAGYNEAQTKLKQADADIAKQSQKVATLKSNLAQLAMLQYQTNGVNMTAQLLASPDETSFINSLATLNSVTERTNANLQDVQIEQAKLDRLRTDAADYSAKMKAEQDKQADLAKQYDAKEAEAKAVLDRLQADERDRLLALQQQQAQQATTAAAQVTTTSSASSSTSTSTSYGSGEAGSDRAQAAVDWARAQLGKPYVFGSSGPNGFDCSGLTSAAYASVGISLPHSSQSQFRVGTPVNKADLRPGDLLFFYGGITHVGLYIGNGVMVHSAPSGRGVHYSNLATYPSYQGARRVA